MKPNEEIIGTLLVSLLVFGTQNRAKWLDVSIAMLVADANRHQ